jgi:hypothetical protein
VKTDRIAADDKAVWMLGSRVLIPAGVIFHEWQARRLVPVRRRDLA